MPKVTIKHLVYPFLALITLCAGHGCYAVAKTTAPECESDMLPLLTEAWYSERRQMLDHSLRIYTQVAKCAERAKNYSIARLAYWQLSQIQKQLGLHKASEISKRKSNSFADSPLTIEADIISVLLDFEQSIIGYTEISNLSRRLNSFKRIDNLISDFKQENEKLQFQSRSTTLQIHLLLDIAKYFDNEITMKKRITLSSKEQALLNDIHKASKTQTLKEARKQVLERALKLNRMTLKIDSGMPPGENDVWMAKDISLRADIYYEQKLFDKAIRDKRKALRVFYNKQSSADIITALYGLMKIEKTKATSLNTDLNDLLKASSELIEYREKQTAGLSGDTIEIFLKKIKHDYTKHENLLKDTLQNHKTQKNTSAYNKYLKQYLLHVDRMNFRSVRQDFAIYLAIGDQIKHTPSVAKKLEAFTKKIQASQEANHTKKHLQVKPTDAYDSYTVIADSKQLLTTTASDEGNFNSNILGLTQTLSTEKQALVTYLENIKRDNLLSDIPRTNMPTNIDDVTLGMSDAQAIVMYFREQINNTLLKAAVIKAGSAPRIVTLQDTTSKNITNLRDELVTQLSITSADTDDVLRKLADILWRPIGILPEDITVVLTRELLGIPFEALTLNDDSRIIENKHIRYSFGLRNNLVDNKSWRKPKTAFVIGATDFPKSSLPSLPSSGTEITQLKNLLLSHKIQVYPNNKFPELGKQYFMQRRNTDILHISTHSALDAESPLFDALAFPGDYVYSYEMALSNIRSNLVVLSACSLFTDRDNERNPISGIGTAVLARLSPLIVATQWEVNSYATSFFMARFYALLAEGFTPSNALAITKREFIDGKKLRNWFIEHDLEAPTQADIKEFRHPYYWAPFALITQ